MSTTTHQPQHASTDAGRSLPNPPAAHLSAGTWEFLVLITCAVHGVIEDPYHTLEEAEESYRDAVRSATHGPADQFGDIIGVVLRTSTGTVLRSQQWPRG